MNRPGRRGMLHATQARMFLRRYQRKKSGKTHVDYALVESLRSEAGPRQHVVAHWGELNPQQQRRWERSLLFYNRQGEAEQLRLFPNEEHAALPIPQPGFTGLRRVSGIRPAVYGGSWSERQTISSPVRRGFSELALAIP